MELQCRVINVLPLESGTSKAGKEWKRAMVIVQYGDAQYPKTLAVSNMKHPEEFAKLTVGTELTMNIDMKSREFNGRWYTNVNCWKWEVTQLAQSNTKQEWQAAYLQPTQAQPTPPLPQGNDLPF